MERRTFLKALAAAGALMARPGWCVAAEGGEALPFDALFLAILRGFLKNAQASGPSLAVCDFAGGTKLKGCCTPGGKTYVSVARMLPAMAEWIACGREPHAFDGRELSGIVRGIYAAAFDPKHADYWGEPPANRATQRTVESSLVAWSLWRMGPEFIESLGAQTRANVQKWLASCCVVPERDSNHAWFTALNQAVRLELSHKWKEFAGDEQWMLEDLEALDALYQEGNGGWYSDDPKRGVYDYYSFFVFPVFPLYWSQVIGGRYPAWRVRYHARVREFLAQTPRISDARGAHPLYGRSLIYRWAVLTPLVLGYRAGIWPHSPGLLRRMVWLSLAYHAGLGAFDEKLGKLRETCSTEGSSEVREAYIDNGHPYWCMTAFAMLSIPQEDPFWTTPEEPLPVEKGDFITPIRGPRMLLIGTQRTGEVKWVQACPGTRREYYRDKYGKFAYSSQFPFNTTQKGPATVDQALVFRDAVGNEAARTSADEGELLPDGVRTKWSVKLGDAVLRVTTRLRFVDEFELREHVIEGGEGVELIEGSYALPLARDEQAASNIDGLRGSARSGAGAMVMSWGVEGFEKVGVVRVAGLNVVAARTAVVTLRGKLKAGTRRLASLHYASLRPMDEKTLQERSLRIIEQLKKES